MKLLEGNPTAKLQNSNKICTIQQSESKINTVKGEKFSLYIMAFFVLMLTRTFILTINNDINKTWYIQDVNANVSVILINGIKDN